MEIIIAIICSTVIICFFGYLWYQSINPYTDEPVAEGNVVDARGRIIGKWIRYKRIYKNGKVIYHEINYSS